MIQRAPPSIVRNGAIVNELSDSRYATGVPVNVVARQGLSSVWRRLIRSKGEATETVATIPASAPQHTVHPLSLPGRPALGAARKSKRGLGVTSQ